VKHGEEVVRRNPRLWKAYAILGRVYTAVGRSSDGARAFARAELLRRSTIFSGGK
jgi:cytochrome c-type biogenesis protein CcmH/NrfG